MNRGDCVGGSDEKNVGKVVIYVQIVVVESDILLRIKNFQKGGRRVSLIVCPYFVNLVKDDDRIGSPGFLDTAEDTARKSSDVGLAMASQFSLIVHSAKGDPDIFPAQRPCH